MNEFRYTSQNPDEIIGLPFVDGNASEDYSLPHVPDARPDLPDNFFLLPLAKFPTTTKIEDHKKLIQYIAT